MYIRTCMLHSVIFSPHLPSSPSFFLSPSLLVSSFPSLLPFPSPGPFPSSPIPFNPLLSSSTLPIQTLRCNSTAAALWPCPHHGHSGLPDGSSVCFPPAHPESCWPGGHAVPLGQDLHRLDLFRHSWNTPDR